jgi:uncharacterized LabA/DUF88 family protein
MRAFDLPAGTRTGVLIDGPHLWATSRSLGFNIDYQKILDEVRSEGTLVEAIFVTPVREDADRDPMKPVTDWMGDNGFTVHTRPLATFTDSRGMVRHDGSCGVQLAVDLMDLAGKAEHIILFCGDANLVPAVRAARERGAAVTIVSTVAETTARAAPEIRAAADRFLDIADLRERLERAFPGRQEAPERGRPVAQAGARPCAPNVNRRARHRAARRARTAPQR